jgi:hypothetical protein
MDLKRSLPSLSPAFPSNATLPSNQSQILNQSAVQCGAVLQSETEALIELQS